jgi:hypothetical protein
MSDHPPPAYLPPATPPASAVPASVIVYEGMRMAPSLVCLVIVGMLIHGHSISSEMGMMGLLAILAGQLYPKNQGPGK